MLRELMGIKKNLDIQLTEEEKQFIKEFELNEPQNQIKFLLESFMKESQSESDKVRDILEQDLINVIGNINSVRMSIENDYRSDEQKKHFLESELQSLQQNMLKAMEKNKSYISNIMKIDSRTEWEKWIHFLSGYRDASKYAYLARKSFETIMQGMAYAYILSEKLGINIRGENRLEGEFQRFVNWILDRNICKIMDDYDEMHSGFWLTVPSMCLNAINQKEIKEYIDKEHIDLENAEIIF